jgi:UV radiation resistance-associated gene protein
MPAPPPLPHLRPENRRIRHLRGISLRNLTFVRKREQSIDDAGINKSPSKLEALRQPQLHTSRSTESLKPTKQRRRSANLADPDHGMQQQLVDHVICDAVFSLHTDDEAEPIYISELRERSMVRLPSATLFVFVPLLNQFRSLPEF